MSNDFTHLWNDLPKEERVRLMPYAIESQVRHVLQTRNILVRGHARTLAEIDQHIRNLDRELEKHRTPGSDKEGTEI